MAIKKKIKKTKKPATKKTKKSSIKKAAKKSAAKKTKKSSIKKAAKKPATKKTKKSSIKKAAKKTKKSSIKKAAKKSAAKKTKKPAAVQKIPKVPKLLLKKEKPIKVKKIKPPAKVRIPVKLALREKELESILEKETENKRILKDMQGRNYCLVESCDFPSIVEGYCRLHYFAGWKVILQRKKLLEEKFLEKIFFRLLEKYSGAILEYIFKDLNSEKSFFSVVKKLEDDGDFDIEDENLLSFLEE